jgi:hypothetical protein
MDPFAIVNSKKFLRNRAADRVIAFALPLLFATSPSYAENDLSLRVSSLESRMTAIKNETVKKTTGAKFSSASPLIDGYGFFISGDLLFWHLKEDGCNDCLCQKQLTLPDPLPCLGKAKHTHFNWDFGFRTAVGYNMEHDAWDWHLNFTWFHTDASDSSHCPENAGVSPQKGFDLIPRAEKMKSHWHVHYYVLDLEIGRRYFVSKFLCFRPQFGIENAWICQRRRYAIKTEADPVTEVWRENIYGKNNFWGMGPRAGVEGNWYLTNHFSIMGALNIALQWGHFDTALSKTNLTAAGKVKTVDVDGDFHRLVPNAQMALGLGWGSNINADQNHLQIRLSYEFQYWWRQNQFLNAQYNDANFQHASMDLSLNGITIDVRFDF